MRRLLGVLFLGSGWLAFGWLAWRYPASPPVPGRPILAVVDEAGLDRALCRASTIEAKWAGWAVARATPCECAPSAWLGDATPMPRDHAK